MIERLNVNISMNEKQKSILDALVLYASNQAGYAMSVSKVVRCMIKFCDENKSTISFDKE